MTLERFEMSREDAIALANSDAWKAWSHRQRATFQLRCVQLCMPFDEFHASVEKTLGRPVGIHEFVWPEKLWDEMTGDKPAPTFAEIVALVPKNLTVVLVEKEDKP